MRVLIETLEASFESLENRSFGLVEEMTDDILYLRPPSSAESRLNVSSGEMLVRSAAAMEQVFGGITTRLWDDPFEWTLPEELRGCAEVENYLKQCTDTRRTAFAYFKNDKELFAQIPAPDRLRPVIEVLLEALVRASHLQGRAFAAAQYSLTIRNKFG